MTPAEFARRKPVTTLGASLSISAPTGDYNPDRLVNIGTNRWAMKPEVGIALPVGRWTFEATVGAWFFANNDDFYGGRVRKQDPLASVQGHVIYTFRPHLWLALDATYCGRRAIGNCRRRARRPAIECALRRDARRAAHPCPVTEISLERRRDDAHRQRFYDLGHRLAVRPYPVST
jgi:hypothetical protein